MDLFGLGMDSQAFHKVWNGTAWEEPWVSARRVFTSSIAVALRGANLLDLFGLGWTIRCSQTLGWQESPVGLGGNGRRVYQSPAVVSMAKNRIDVFGWRPTTNWCTGGGTRNAWSGAFEHWVETSPASPRW
jgi:hypothetical protein